MRWVYPALAADCGLHAAFQLGNRCRTEMPRKGDRREAVIFQTSSQQKLLDQDCKYGLLGQLRPRGGMGWVHHQANSQFGIVAQKVRPLSAEDAAILLPEPRADA